MRIGALASQTELSVQTIRFYEREGLLRKPARTGSGYRSYEQRDLEQVQFIRACQELGFTLREIKQLIRLHQVNTSLAQASIRPESIRGIISLAKERVATIEEKMTSLSRMREEMQRLIRELSANASPSCPARGSAFNGRRKLGATGKSSS